MPAAALNLPESTPQGRRIARALSAIHINIGIFLLATVTSFLSAYNDRPITTVLLYQTGIVIISARSGFRSGVFAALCASVIYNFFLSEPVYQFIIRTIDEVIPIVAFNSSAVVAAYVVGRLKERATAAEAAERQVALLLVVSDAVQNVVEVSQFASTLRKLEDNPIIARAQLYRLADGTLTPVAEEIDWQDHAKTLLETGNHIDHVDGISRLRLEANDEVLGVLLIQWLDGFDPGSGLDLGAIANIFSIAIERCLLLGRRAEAEAWRRSEHLKSSLLASISHDIRSPLAAIAASTDSLIALGAEAKLPLRSDLLANIARECQRLDRFTANLLELGRLQGGFASTSLELVDLAEVIGTVIAQARGRAPDHRLEKSLPAQEMLVKANPVMAEHLFANIVENAVRYSPPGASILIAAEIGEDEIMVRTTDDGPGIRAIDLPHVFDRFYRGEASAEKEGQGLGLAIAKGFAEAFGGDIAIRSPVRDGHGTEVRVTLPRNRDHHDG